MRRSCFGLLSLALHLLFFGLVFLGFPILKVEQKPFVEVDLQTSESMNESDRRLVSKSRDVPATRFPKGRSLRLVPDYDFRKNFAAKDETTGVEINPDPFSNDNQANLFNQYEGLDRHQVRLADSLAGGINHEIEDNGYLGEYGLSGDVSVQVQLNGSLDPTTVKFSACAQDDVLKVIALRSVKELMTVSMLQSLKDSQVKMVTAFFRWSPSEACTSRVAQRGFSFSFCRNTRNQKRDFSASEKLKVLGSAISAGPDALDVIRKYRQEKFRRDTEFDPFDSYRRDPLAKVACNHRRTG